MHRFEDMGRYGTFAATVALAVLSLIGLMWSGWFWLPLILFGGGSLVGLHDVTQDHHSILRNYPVMGHIRFMLESIRPEICQYMLEGDRDEEPFSREMRSLVYQRAKGQEDKRPFGTKEKVYESGYQWLTHSIQPHHIADCDS
jgi:glutamate synthase domain-containing protein 2